jgi:iron complex transport system ATP-binding protein
VIEVERVRVAYDGHPAVSDLTLGVPGGAWLGLIGPNGAGKSTLLRAIAGLVSFSGEVRLNGSPVRSMPRRKLARLVAFVPQRPTVPDGMTVTDYVLMGRTPYIPYLGTESRRDLEVAAEALERLELAELSARTLGTLSGGEVQRAVLARALCQRAPVLLLDEPTAALDVGHQLQVLELVDGLRTEHGLTVVGAMHDLTLAGQFADSLLLLSGGRAVAAGPAPAVLTESSIKEHYGASVKVLEGPDGTTLVIPTRLQRGAPAQGVVVDS